MRCFLAGPFFNDECRKTLTSLLHFLEHELHHTVFCAMRDGLLVPKDATEIIRQKYFLLDVTKARWTDCLVALLDYPLSIYQKLILQEKTPEGITQRNILLPDTGTVFEMGLAYACEKPIIGFAKNIHSLNLMLAQSCAIIVSNYSELKEALFEIELGTLKHKPSSKELFQL